MVHQVLAEVAHPAGLFHLRARHAVSNSPPLNALADFGNLGHPFVTRYGPCMLLKTGDGLQCAVEIFDIGAANGTVNGLEKDGTGFGPRRRNLLYFYASKVFLDYCCSHIWHLIMAGNEIYYTRNMCCSGKLQLIYKDAHYRELTWAK
jgi:hypothetical protein